SLDECSACGEPRLSRITGKKLPEEPRQSRVDCVVPVTLLSQQAHLSGAAEERNAGLTCKATHFWEAPRYIGIPHQAQSTHTNKSLEQVKQCQLPPFLLGECVLEAIGKRSRERLRPPLALVIVERRLPT